MSYKKSVLLGTAVCCCALASTSLLSAATLEIGFLGADFSFFDDGFSGGTLFDAASPDGGVGDPVFADPLDAVSITIDGVLDSVITTDIFLDVRIFVDIPVPSSPGVTTAVSGPGIFDILIDGEELLVDVDSVDITFVDATTASFVFGAEISSDIASDTLTLPGGLSVGAPIEIAFSATVVSGTLVDDGAVITEFDASGSGTITAELVPEPAAGMLIALALPTLFRRRRRR